MTGGGSRDRDEAPPSATEIEIEIRRTRAALGLTLDALEHQLAPRQLIGKGAGMIARSIKANEKAWIDVGEAVRAHPIPLALIGVGVAWLLAANFGIAGGRAEEEGSSGTAAARSVRKAAGSAEQVGHAGRSLRASVERHPLRVGLAGLICGAAMAALLPSSRREQDWLDAARGELLDKAEAIGHQAADRVRSVAEQNPARPIVDC
jgi:Protein of unknown function (DUF3618)